MPGESIRSHRKRLVVATDTDLFRIWNRMAKLFPNLHDLLTVARVEDWA